MMKIMKWVVLVTVAAMSSSLLASDLFRDQMTDGTGWAINSPAAPADDTTAAFGYDYSADGIPEAPGFQPGDAATSGLKLTANNGDAADAGAFQTLYPTGESFTGTHRLSFDMWMNYDAVEKNEGTAAGTTEFMGGGIGFSGAGVDVGDGHQFIATGDGGSGSDWRAFKAGTFLATGDMIAGSRNGAVAYYADFLPGVDPPASQGQVGATPPQLSEPGSPGFQWITMHVETKDDQVNGFIEKPTGETLLMYSYNKTAAGPGDTDIGTDGNISIFYADFFSSISPAPALTFGIVDNVRVSSVPEPSAAALLFFGLAGLVLRRRR